MKYLVLILAISLCVSSVWAGDPTATKFVDLVKTFSDNNFPSEGEFNKDSFMSEINSLAGEVKVIAPVKAEAAVEAKAAVAEVKDEKGNVITKGEAAVEAKAAVAEVKGYDPSLSFDPTAFMAGLNTELAKIDTTGVTDENIKKEVANIKAGLMYELSFFLKGYLEDMKIGGVMQGDATVKGLDTALYVADIANLIADKKREIDFAKNPPAADTTASTTKVAAHNPENYLDTVFGDKDAKRASVKLDYFWGGRFGNWSNKSLKFVMDEFKRFFGNAIQADLAALEDIWPQGAEVYTMNNAGYTTPTINEPKSFELNEYGKLAEYDTNTYDENGTPEEKEKKKKQDEEKEYRKRQFENPSNQGAVNDYTHNNRQWSGIPNGTYTTVKLTTNGREYTMQQYFYTSPIVLDMDGDNKLEASRGEWLPHDYNGSKIVEFDMDGDGFIDLTEWVGPNDGLLMISGTTEVSANELFGNAGGFMDGYEKLSLLDKNRDGKLTAAELATLSVWQDKNGNAKVDSGEVSTVVELGITSINVKANDKSVSSFEHNGTIKTVWDWYPVVYAVKRTR